MKTRSAIVLSLALTAAASAAAMNTQDKGKSSQAGQTVPASAAKWKEFGTPGQAHHALDGRIGKWNVDVKMFEPGNATPTESKGTSEVKWIMDGRFIEENVTGEWMGQPFQGRGTSGYDNIKQKYVSTWVDNMSTGVMYAEGTADSGGKGFTFNGECPDPVSGKYTRGRSVDKMVDADHWTMQSYKMGPDGKEFLAGQLDYTRAK